MEKIKKILNKLKINDDDLKFYGNNITKIDYENYFCNKKKGKLILMTSINPTQAGEGKTTTAIGLADGLNYLKKSVILALREPSIGPVFGRKGTATGGGESEIEPMSEINLHFTGDIHAISTANNLVSATIDSEIYWNSKLNFDSNRIVWKRCLDLNDRALRNMEIQISKNVSRKEEFTITAASNMMTILSLSKSEEDLRDRINDSLIAYDKNGEPIFLKSLEITGSLMVLLKDAIKPNFVLTKNDTPALVHCGPFANIATGTNSIISTNLALNLADYCIVESGFGSDLGFEKYMNIINNENDLIPDCVVMVITLRALNLHKDFENNFTHLEQHLKHVRLYNLNLVVAINFINGDSEKQLIALQDWLTKNNYEWELNEAYNKGPIGAVNLANRVIENSNRQFKFKTLINSQDSIKEKIKKIVNNFYYLNEINYTENAENSISQINLSKYKEYPICMVKSSNSIDGNDFNQKNYKLIIDKVIVNSGARFILVFTNNVMSMPGLNKNPNSKIIDLVNKKVCGLK
ncbi:formate--tetrahydrofolate ligase [Spiroplasma taiwanense]|uniref:Formate--tetrahydrofolate ligase n=1 Tax=Spiroplasma taiwanense CT-1 TaxID=1276220 RepID=S5MAS4_9MOLU|nr:formate--tetrahydrofolate ligase [Spiroplasma taiwanense]AGR40863.1 formate--tetrahydrofolate ligase [Spiroplasma taiwanense CT-1]